jgi:hypothetical protein
MEGPHVGAQKFDKSLLVPRNLDTNVLNRHRRDDTRLPTSTSVLFLLDTWIEHMYD